MQLAGLVIKVNNVAQLVNWAPVDNLHARVDIQTLSSMPQHETVVCTS